MTNFLREGLFNTAGLRQRVTRRKMSGVKFLSSFLTQEEELQKERERTLEKKESTKVIEAFLLKYASGLKWSMRLSK